MLDADLFANAGRWFDRTWYLLRNPDVARVGIDPLVHYLHYGEAEGRNPSPWFDPIWYRAAYGILPGACALGHFLAWRTTGRFLPCAALYPVPHLVPWSGHPAVGVDPFDHYLTDMLVPERELIPELALISASGLIDTMYYRINPAGPYEDELDPALHYCRFGWRRGFRPSTAFDPAWYAETNSAAARLMINPVSHYILEGERANRRPVPWFDPAWYRSTYGVPPDQLALAHFLAHRQTRTVSPNPLFDVSWYVARHAAAIPAEVDPFSHFLLSGAMRDVDPSPLFDARAWRYRHMAPSMADGQSDLALEARNPLVHHLRLVYAAT